MYTAMEFAAQLADGLLVVLAWVGAGVAAGLVLFVVFFGIWKAFLLFDDLIKSGAGDDESSGYGSYDDYKSSGKSMGAYESKDIEAAYSERYERQFQDSMAFAQANGIEDEWEAAEWANDRVSDLKYIDSQDPVDPAYFNK